MATLLEYAFISILAVYLFGAVLSLLFHQKDHWANTLSNSVNMAASILGILFSLCFLFQSYICSHFLTSETNPGNILLSVESNVNSISIAFRIDSLSALFILIISLLSFIVSIYSMGYLKQFYQKRNLGYFGFLYNSFIASMILVVTSGNLFFFLIVWEVMSLVSYFLVVYESEKLETQKAGLMYVVMTHIGTAFIIAAFILVYQYTGTADLSFIDGSKIPVGAKNLIFLFSLIGFGTKAGIIPLHIWLPKAHPAAPGNISALMSGVMIKSAIYGILRVVFGILGPQYVWWGTVIFILGAISTILGIAYALMEIDIKRLLAYSSVENMGIMLMGTGVAVMAAAAGNMLIAAIALAASLFHVFNHSIFKGLLFMGAGSVHYAVKTKNMEKLGGLIKRMPVTAVFFLLGALAISAIPPFNGFVSEWLTYQSLFMNLGLQPDWLKIILILGAAILAMAGVFAAYSLIKAFGISFLAMPRTQAASEAKEVPKTMLAGMGIPAVLCLVIGVFPFTILKMMDKINMEFLHTTMLDQTSGFSSFVMLPVNAAKSTISPIALIAVAAILIPVLFYFIAFVKLKTRVRKYKTWDCGYIELNPKMQYTATGFSKPIRILFRAIFKPQRELELEEGASVYHFKNAKYVVSMQSIFEKYLYEPVIKNVIGFAHKTRYVIQTGSIHTYLIYIFIVILAMLVYFIKA